MVPVLIRSMHELSHMLTALEANEYLHSGTVRRALQSQSVMKLLPEAYVQLTCDD